MKVNRYMNRKELTIVRETLKEERMKRFKLTKQRQRWKRNKEIGYDQPQGKGKGEVELSDLYHPLNHFGYKRFKKWM